MALEGKQRVVAIHPYAIVNHANHRNATAANHHVDLTGTGVDTVFDELLDDRSRALDDLAGRYLAGNGFWEQSDAAHGEVKMLIG